MTLKDKLRLALLTAKADRSVEENTELETLVASAKAANLNPEVVAKEFAPDVEDDNGAVTDVQLKTLIETAVRNSLPANSSAADTETVVKEIRELASKSAQGLQLSEVEEIVSKHVGANAFDKEALLSEVKKLMPEQGVTKQELSEAFDTFAKSMRTPSKVVHDTGTSSFDAFPVEHRNGNLSVAQKQLLNLCVMNVSDQAKQETQRQNGGKALPTHMNDGITADQLSHADRAGEQSIKSIRNSVLGGKALGSGLADPNGHGLMPMNLSSDLQARMYLESVLAAEMLSMEVDMPTQPFEFPLVTSRPSFYLGSELLEFGTPNSRPTESSPGTARITLDAKKLIGMSEYSYEADEDAIIAILPMIQQQLASAAADAYEGALINGDTSATHMDTDARVTGHHAKLFKGFRRYALDGDCLVDLTSGGITANNLIKMRKKMLRWGMKPAELMLVVGPQGYNDLVGLDETLSFYKVGSQAQTRILTGEAPSIFGIRILVSSQVREDLTASGVYDRDGIHTKGCLFLIHKPSWVVGSRRGFTVEIDQSKLRQTNSVVASFRRAFTPKEVPSVSMPTVIMGLNYYTSTGNTGA